MPDTTASAETTPSSTGQASGTETDTTALALWLPTQSSSPPQVSFSWAIVSVSPSRVTVSAPSSWLTSRWAPPVPAASLLPTTSMLPATMRTLSRRTPSRSRDWGVSIRHCVTVSVSYSRCIASVEIHDISRLADVKCRAGSFSRSVLVVVEAGQPGGQPLDRDLELGVEVDELAQPARPASRASPTPRRGVPRAPRCRGR